MICGGVIVLIRRNDAAALENGIAHIDVVLHGLGHKGVKLLLRRLLDTWTASLPWMTEPSA